jgi:general secretion pathway protein N
MSLKKQLALFVIALTLFVFMLAPISLVSKYLPIPDNVAYQGLQGTLWSGKVNAVQVDHWHLQTVTWQVRPLELLTGNLTVKIKAGNARDAQQISAKGTIKIGFSNITFDKFILRTPADNIRPIIPIPVGRIGGRAIIELDQYKVARSAFDQSSTTGFCNTLSGEALWTKSEIQIGSPINLGTFVGALSCENNDVLLTFDGENRLGLNGQGRVSKTRSLHFDGLVDPDKTLPNSIINGVAMFGKRDQQGRYQINI